VFRKAVRACVCQGKKRTRGNESKGGYEQRRGEGGNQTKQAGFPWRRKTLRKFGGESACWERGGGVVEKSGEGESIRRENEEGRERNSRKPTCPTKVCRKTKKKTLTKKEEGGGKRNKVREWDCYWLAWVKGSVVASQDRDPKGTSGKKRKGGLAGSRGGGQPAEGRIGKLQPGEGRGKR